MSVTVTKIDKGGRLVLPAQYRQSLGLEPGAPVVLTVVGDELRVRSFESAMAEQQADAAQFLSGEEASVDAFLAERRAQAAREAGGWSKPPAPVAAPEEAVAGGQ